MSIDILTQDGSIPVGGGNPAYASLTSHDPRGDSAAYDLMNANPSDLEIWHTQLLTLSQEGDGANRRLTGIADAVDWKGDGATAFQLSVKQTAAPLVNLAEAYSDAAWAIDTYADTVHNELQPAFQTQADLIRTYTFQLTGYQPSDDSYRPASYHFTHKQVTVQSPNFQTVLGDLQSAKTAAAGVLDEFQTAVQTLQSALVKAAENAPKAPPWWQRQMDSGIVEASGLKGVTSTEVTDALGLAAAEYAYLQDPSTKNKAILDRDLAALSALATAAGKDGDTSLEDQLLDDEAGSLQRLSDAEAGVLGSGKNVTATQDDENQIVKDLAAGNPSAAEKLLQTMAVAAMGTKSGAATTKATTAAETQADGEDSGVTKELGGASTSGKGPAQGGAPTPTTGPTAPGNGMTQEQSTKINEMLDQAKSMVGDSYAWGGGHSGWGPQPGYDCSGFVSKVLHAAGYLSSPQTTYTLPGQPGIDPGPGKYVTIYDRSTGPIDQQHVIIDIDGHWYESGGDHYSWGGGGGVEPIAQPAQWYLNSFGTILHPAGL